MTVRVCARLTEEIFDEQKFPGADGVTLTNDTLEIVDDNREDPVRVYMSEDVIWFEPEP